MTLPPTRSTWTARSGNHVMSRCLPAPQCIVLSARSDLDGPVEIEVWVGASEHRPAGHLLSEGELLATVNSECLWLFALSTARQIIRGGSQLRTEAILKDVDHHIHSRRYEQQTHDQDCPMP